MSLPFGAERPSCSRLPRSQLTSVHRTPNRAAVEPRETGGGMCSMQLSASSLRGGLEEEHYSAQKTWTGDKPSGARKSIHSTANAQFQEPRTEPGRQAGGQRTRKPEWRTSVEVTIEIKTATVISICGVSTMCQLSCLRTSLQCTQ